MPTDFEAKFGMTIQERARLVMEDECKRNPEPLWWYLSYAHETKGFMGGTIVQAHGFVGACDYARRHGITPAPDVETQGVPIPPREVPEEKYRNRLLTRDELESFWGAMKSFRGYDEEREKKDNAG